jgi:spermidine/putrescine transport system substrate-binding protein
VEGHPNGIGRAAFLRMAALAGGALALGACGDDTEEEPESSAAASAPASTPAASSAAESSAAETTAAETAAAETTAPAASEPPATSGPSLEEGLATEKGSLEVLEWQGYEVPDLYPGYAAVAPAPPKFTFLIDDGQAVSKVAAGFKTDVTHPCVGYIDEWVNAGLVQPWDTSLISRFPDLHPDLVKAGQVDGQQYFIPLDWGYSSIMYRADKVQVDELSWSVLWDDRYEGKIGWFDSAGDMVPLAGYALGFADPWNMSEDELEQVKQTLIDGKKNVRIIWGSQADMENDVKAGNIWVTYAWPASWVNMKKEGLDVTYGFPKEGSLAFLCGLVLSKDTDRYYSAHAFADAWADPAAGIWMLENYAYGHSNTTIDLSQVPPELVSAFHLDDPSALDEPKVHINRNIPDRKAYSRVWEEVKAA